MDVKTESVPVVEFESRGAILISIRRDELHAIGKDWTQIIQLSNRTIRNVTEELVSRFELFLPIEPASLLPADRFILGDTEIARNSRGTLYARVELPPVPPFQIVMDQFDYEDWFL